MKTVAMERATERILPWMRAMLSDPPIKAVEVGRLARAPGDGGDVDRDSGAGDGASDGRGRDGLADSAFSTAPRKRASSKGRTRKSQAPARIASTAREIEALAVMTMTRVSGRIASRSAIRSRPSRSGNIRSSSTTCVPLSAKPASASAAELAMRTSWPAPVRIVRNIACRDGVSSTSSNGRLMAPGPALGAVPPRGIGPGNARQG